MDLSKYRNLPDSLTPDQTRSLLEELMQLPKPSGESEAVAMAKAFDQVADGHWHTYVLLDEVTRNRVDDWVLQNWNHNSAELVQYLIAVIAKLGLVRSCRMLRTELSADISIAIKKTVEGALREFESTISDPYAGMRHSRRSP